MYRDECILVVRVRLLRFFRASEAGAPRASNDRRRRQRPRRDSIDADARLTRGIRPRNVQDEKDAIIGHDSKYASHRFIPDQPRGKLHRAFSVFLFDENHRLLLQQRAASKITFPSLWTNTCCSHPLYGYEPSEVDTDEDVRSGSVPGAKRAAIRKLKHELGVASSAVPLEKFKYLTRLHYCAADAFATNQDVSGGPWGEHEMDYILFIKPETRVAFEPNPEEVDDAKWVTRDELREMMDPKSGLRWSPWFRIIAEKFLDKWWADLDNCLTTDAHVDLETVHEVM